MSNGQRNMKNWQRIALASAVLGAAVAATFVLIRSKAPVAAKPVDAVVASNRMKGGAADTELRVFRQTSHGSEEVLSGDAFAPGDTIRFAVDLLTRSRVKIIGVEADGHTYRVWPQELSMPDVVGAGEDKILDGAVTLDAKPGQETFYLVACPPSIASPDCLSGSLKDAPICDPECSVSRFELHKKSLPFQPAPLAEGK